MKFKSALLTVASGSTGGMTASRNRGGLYLRSRAIPVNPNSSRQAIVRAALGTLVQRWNQTLTAAQRGDWENYAQQVPVTNVFGDQIQLSGQQHFIRSNIPRVQTNDATGIADDAPTTFNTGAPPTSIETLNGGDPQIIGIDGANMSTTINFATPTSGIGQVLIQLGPVVNDGVNRVSGPYQSANIGNNITTIGAASSEDWTTPIADLSVAQPPAAGQRRNVRIRVSYQDGRLSEPLALLAAVQDDPV
jgi:hypothetical protein